VAATACTLTLLLIGYWLVYRRNLAVIPKQFEPVDPPAIAR
jgi:hypothetical protein